MPRKYLKRITFTLNGDKWKGLLVSDAQIAVHKDSDDEELHGLCDSEERVIYIAKPFLTEPRVRHEICHAFIHYTYSEFANLNQGEFEEIVCEMFAKRGAEMLQLSNDIFRKMSQ